VLREVAHFLRHAPATVALKSRVSQDELYETVMARADAAGLAEQRTALVRGLRGRVLEIGAGTGAMFPHYASDVELVALEPDERFVARARERERAGATKCTVRIVVGSALDLPFDAASFDAIVSCLVLCSVDDPAKALAEIARVARPGASVRLIEHVRSPHAVAGALMSLFDPVWVALNGQGCHMNRDTEQVLARAGFVLEAVHAFQVFAPGLPAFPMRRIESRVEG
jgi:ubiquinone/menaquinone biosynthesis C-methylase UbiE